MENKEKKPYLYINGKYAGQVAWEFEPAPPVCEAYLNDHTTNSTYRCDLRSGHLGSHSDSTRQQVWPLTTPREYADWFQQEYKTGVLGQWTDPRYTAKVTGEWPEETVTLELTLTDLKTIAYYMAEEEDGDKTKIKIDEALKEML